MSEDALKLARTCVDRWDDITAPAADVAVALARAVIAQAEELERVRAALGEALDEWERSDCCWQHRIAELRRLVP